MVRRVLALVICIAMLISSDSFTALAAENTASAVNSDMIEKNGKVALKQTEDQIGFTDSIQTEDQTGLTEHIQTEDQTAEAEMCQVFFYREDGVTAVKRLSFTKNEKVRLSEVIKYIVSGYEVQWKDMQTDKVLDDEIEISKNMSLKAVLTPVSYEIHFNKNGKKVKGKMENQSLVYSKNYTINKCAYTRKGYHFVGWAQTKGGGAIIADGASEFDGIGYITKKDQVLELYAVWKSDNYLISYELNGGINNNENPNTYTIESGDITLKDASRKGYTFDGWYTDSSYKNKITTIDTTKLKKITVYAKWNPNTYKITYILNGGKNNSSNKSTYKVSEKAQAIAEPTKAGCGFEGWYSDAALTKRVKQLAANTYGDKTLYAKWSTTRYRINYKLNGGSNNRKNPTGYYYTSKNVLLYGAKRSGYYFNGWYSDSKLKKKVDYIKGGSKGDKVLYAKWEKEYPVSTSASKIKVCEATGKNHIKVTAKVSNRIASSDNKYYLAMTGFEDKGIARVVASSDKRSDLAFDLDVSKNRGYALGRYVIAVKKGKNYKPISAVSDYISNPQKLATNKSVYVYGKTKKGLQSSNMDEISDTGSNNMFLNINTSVVLSNAATEPTTYTYNGVTYKFGALGGYLYQIRRANQQGINVTMQINLDADTFNYDPRIISPKARGKGHLYYAWNTSERAGREKMEAIFCYLAETFGQADCHVSNWVLSNEVNSCDVWYYRGSMSNSQTVKNYAYAYRCLYNAAKSVRSSTKVYICADHVWNTKHATSAGMSSQYFMSKFADHIENIQDGVKWDIAFHPYSARLECAAFWSPESYYSNKKLVNNTEKTGYITMSNLNVLTKYVKKHYGNKSIILSEIGFHYGDSQTKQAAAVAYAYNIAACNDMIDSFLMRSYNDEAGDGILRFGIRGRKAYNVFRYMNTVNAESYTNAYLKTLKTTSWRKLIKSYSVKKLYKNNAC